jgi:CHAD domain-containing protein
MQPNPAHSWRSALALRISTRGRRLDKAIDEAGQIYAPEALHQVRIAAKKLRYALEIADESGAVPCAPTLRAIKKAQDALGRLHDLQILQHHVAAVGAAPRGRRSTPDAGLAVLSRLIEDRCRHLHGRYVSQLPSLREAAAAARRDIPLRLTSRQRPTRSTTMDLGERRRSGGRHVSGASTRPQRVERR